MSDYHDIHIRISTGGPREPRGSRGGRRQDCKWDCPYCRRSGVDPYGIMGNEECPACHGGRYWIADISCDKLYLCDTCDGTGVVEDCGFMRPCGICKGCGRVRD